MKKLLSLLLTAAMLCALTLPATFATATTPADNAQTRNADIFDFIDILEDCVGMVELTPVEVYDHNKNGVVDIFDGIIVLEGIIGLGDCVTMPREKTIEPLDENTERRIKDEWRKIPENYMEYYSVYYMRLLYLGTYNGYVAFIMSTPSNGILDCIDVHEIAGYRFVFGAGGYKIEVWNDGEFQLLSEAYDKGLISEEDIANIWCCYENSDPYWSDLGDLFEN